MEECICAIDLGTTSTRVMLFDRKWRVVAEHQKEISQHCPRRGWVEHDPMELLQTIDECIESALKAAKQEGRDSRVVAVGITNQRETSLAWDKNTGQPLHKAIVWFDNRTASLCHKIGKELGSADHFRKTTGLPISSYFSAYKFRWLAENVPEVSSAIEEGRCLIGTLDTWIIWNLTGGLNGGIMVTDVSNASRTNLMDLKTLAWAPQLLKMFGIKQEMLADIKSNAEVFGKISYGPLEGVPIAGTTAIQSSHGLITTIAYKLGAKAEPHYALEGSIAVGGSGVRWLRDNLGVIKSPEECEPIASSVPDSAGVIFVPAFNGILAPHWRDDARGIILGLSNYTNTAHIVRAMLEAICWQTREVLDAMRDDCSELEVSLLRVDGGASCNNLLMQIQADYLQIPVQRPEMMETTALGAAYAAAVGIGWCDSGEVLQHGAAGSVKHRTFQPELESSLYRRKYEHWKMAVQRSYDLAGMTET